MVQLLFNGHFTPRSIDVSGNCYWKLGPREYENLVDMQQFLSEHGFYHRAALRRPRAVWLVTRCQRDLLSYESYKVAELRQIALKVGLPANTRKMPHAMLVSALEDADENRPFHQLLDLPPELRNRIYSFVFESYPEIRLRSRVRQPPLALVSRTLRGETLPKFYAECQFKVDLTCRPLYTRQTLQIESPSKAAIQNIKPLHFSYMQRLVFSLQISEQDIDYGFHCQIDLRPISDSGHKPGLRLPFITMTAYPASLKDHPPKPEDYAERRGALVGQLDAVVQRILRREGLYKMLKTDFDALHNAVFRAVPGIKQVK